MQRTLVLILSALIAPLALGCIGEDIGSRTDRIQSCYQTAAGSIKCVNTPGEIYAEDVDIDDDGQVDTFVCGDGPSASDSDGDSTEDSDSVSDTEDGTEDGLLAAEGDDDLDADSESTSDNDSESDTDCGPSDNDEDSDSESDLDGDGDADYVPDEYDCDCPGVVDTPPAPVE